MKSTKKQVNETASTGSTSAGAVASVSTGLNFPLLTRMPKTDIYGYSEYNPKKKSDTDK